MARKRILRKHAQLNLVHPTQVPEARPSLGVAQSEGMDMPWSTSRPQSYLQSRHCCIVERTSTGASDPMALSKSSAGAPTLHRAGTYHAF